MRERTTQWIPWCGVVRGHLGSWLPIIVGIRYSYVYAFCGLCFQFSSIFKAFAHYFNPSHGVSLSGQSGFWGMVYSVVQFLNFGIRFRIISHFKDEPRISPMQLVFFLLLFFSASSTQSPDTLWDWVEEAPKNISSECLFLVLCLESRAFDHSTQAVGPEAESASISQERKYT